jgi:hypothetical protein
METPDPLGNAEDPAFLGDGRRDALVGQAGRSAEQSCQGSRIVQFGQPGGGCAYLASTAASDAAFASVGQTSAYTMDDEGARKPVSNGHTVDRS